MTLMAIMMSYRLMSSFQASYQKNSHGRSTTKEIICDKWASQSIKSRQRSRVSDLKSGSSKKTANESIELDII